MTGDTATEVWFYHLERGDLDSAVINLVRLCLDRSIRLRIQTLSQQAARALDDRLWDQTKLSFLPHGLEGGEFEARQPVLVGYEDVRVTGRDALLLLDGAQNSHIPDYKRVMLLFDGRDDGQLGQAREAWRKGKTQGLSMSYWQQGERGWEKRQ